MTATASGVSARLRRVAAIASGLALLAAAPALGAPRLRAQSVCPTPAPGYVQCEAERLVVRATGTPVHPHPRRRAAAEVVGSVPRAFAAMTPPAAQAPPATGTPAYLQQAYDLSALSAVGGTTAKVAVIDAQDDPNAESDLDTYRAQFGLPACTTANGCFEKVDESGQPAPLPTPDTGWSQEISLDLDAVSALCPNCRIILVEANSSSNADMSTADATADALGANVISDSWAEGSQNPYPGTFNFAGVATVASAGDTGYMTPYWYAYPAALPGVIAAGATTLSGTTTAGRTGRGFVETAWSRVNSAGGGSGCDTVEAKPAWQTGACAGRAYADLSADGNPSTGLEVYDSSAGGWLILGGTSLSAPLIAGYLGLIGAGATTPQWAYLNAALLNDPISGTSGTCAATIAYICNAGVGYDGPTGAGSISGDVVTGAPGIGGPPIGTGTGNSYALAATAFTATLAGGIYPNGEPTTYYWQYGTTTAYGSQSAAASAGTTQTAVAIATVLSGLTPGTTYHYRLVAQNATGTTYGYDYSLTTQPGPKPAVTRAATLTGTFREGQTLTANPGTWTPASTFTYQWQRAVSGSWVDLSGATGPTYTLESSDVGTYVRAQVTATDPYGATVIATAAGSKTVSGAPILVRAPALSGTARAGLTMTAGTGSWNPSSSDSYQWQRDVGRSWINVAGATSSSYKLGSSDVGTEVRAQVTATDQYGATVAFTASSAKVAASATASAGARPGARGRGKVKAAVKPARGRARVRAAR